MSANRCRKALKAAVWFRCSPTPAPERCNRPREEFVVHFPHYDKDAIGPASAILLGDFKLIRAYETGALRLFNIAKDPGERHDLAQEMPDKVKELDQRLTDYLAGSERPDAEPESELRRHQADGNQARRQAKGEAMMRWCVLLLISVGLAAHAAEEKPARKGGSRQPVQTSKCNDVPAHPFDLILGRPTSNSVTVSVLCYEDAEGFIAYGTQPGKLAAQTPARPFRKGEPVEIVLSPLQPNTRYFYQLRLALTNSGEFTFHTARPPGSAFTFTITADSHLDEHTDPALYQRTLANALADAPDFHIDLGDTFMTEKHPSREAPPSNISPSATTSANSATPRRCSSCWAITTAKARAAAAATPTAWPSGRT